MFRRCFNYAYSFREILEGITQSSIKLDNVPTYKTCFGYLFNNESGLAPEWTEGDGKDLFEALFQNYADYVCVISGKILENENDYKLASTNFGERIYATFNRTKVFYKKMLSLYKSNENKLLDKLKNKTSFINRFNDTAENGGDFSDDEHTSYVTQGESESELETANLMNRLDEIKRLYFDGLSEWVNEFRGLFANPLNFEDLGV